MGEVLLRLVHDVPARAVQFPYPGPLPQGGRKKLDTTVAEMFLVQAALMCAPEGSQQFEMALKRRGELLKMMDATQRDHMAAIASAVGRLAISR